MLDVCVCMYQYVSVCRGGGGGRAYACASLLMFLPSFVLFLFV